MMICSSCRKAFLAGPPPPAPWTLPNTEAWLFVVSFSGKSNQELPPGHFAPLEEAEWSKCCGPEVARGGPANMMLIRYTDTPVGPYDELLIAPGTFSNPNGTVDSRVTRIYVSSQDSIANGRKNWNIAKHLGKFTFTPSPSNPRATEARVYAQTSPTTFSDTPFFAVLLTSIPLIPKLPFNTAYLPEAFKLSTQPPLPSSPNAEEDGEVGTATWKTFSTFIQAYMRPVFVKGLLEAGAAGGTTRFADGVNFPDVMPFSIALHLEKATLEVSAPSEFSVEI